MLKFIVSYLYKTLFIIYVFYPTSIFCQVDSLLNQLKTSEISIEKRAVLYANIAYSHTNPDTALLFAKKSLKIAKEIKSDSLEAAALEEISHIHRVLGNNGLSFNAALDAIKIYQSLKMTEYSAASYNQLASNYMTDNEYVKAIFYLKKAMQIYKKKDRLGNIIFTTSNLGEAYRLAGHLDSAKVCFKSVIIKSEKNNNLIAKSYSQGNLGMVYNTQDSLSLAKNYLQDAITTLTKLEDAYASSVFIAELGDVIQKKGNPKVAEAKFLKAYKIAQDAGLKDQIRNFSQKLTMFYENQGKYSKALYYQKQFQIYQDSIVNKENIQQIERLKASYEIDKRESKISILNATNSNQRNLVIILSITVLTVLIFLYLLHQGNKKIQIANTHLSKQKKIISQREQEKALLLQELNHRVKNNLQIIASLLNLQSNELTDYPAQTALLASKNRVEALSLVHRKLYQEGADTRINLKEYIKELVLGLLHGYNATFSPTFKMADIFVAIDNAIPLALIINELVINAIKHAYTDTNNNKLVIKVNELNSTLKIEVIDNGKSFTPKQKEKKNSFGLKLIYSLVNQIEGNIYKANTSNGTHWVIELKNDLKRDTSILSAIKKESVKKNILKKIRYRSRKGQFLKKSI